MAKIWLRQSQIFAAIWFAKQNLLASTIILFKFWNFCLLINQELCCAQDRRHMELISSYLPTLKPSKIDSVCCSTYYRSSNLKPPYPSGTRVQKCQEEIQAQQIPAYTCKRSTRHAVSESSCIASVTDEPATKPDQTSTSFLRHNQTMGNHLCPVHLADKP